MGIVTNLQVKHRVSKELEQVEAYLTHVLSHGAEDFNTLIRPLSAGGGKRLRAQLFLLIALAGESKKEDRTAIAVAIEMLHLATLIHDDVLDQAEIRRGVPAIHCTKGNKVAILSGDYLFAKAFEEVAKVGSPECLAVFADVIRNLVEGEFMQMEDVNRLDQGVERYLVKTQKKTADFIEACLELGCILGGWSEKDRGHFKTYGHALGMSFQITDDIMDYREQSQTTGKPVGKDLQEGILTYPLLSVVTDTNQAYIQAELENIQHRGAHPKELIQYVIQHGGVDAALALEEQYREEAMQALAQLPDFEGKDVLKRVIESLATRKV